MFGTTGGELLLHCDSKTGVPIPVSEKVAGEESPKRLGFGTQSKETRNTGVDYYTFMLAWGQKALHKFT